MQKKTVTLLTSLVIATTMLAGCGDKVPANNTAETEVMEITDVAVIETEDSNTETQTEAVEETETVEETEAVEETETVEETEAVEETETVNYTYTDIDAIKYAKSAVNVRSLPSKDGERIGSLSLNNDVKVTGRCNETGWYRIEYAGKTAYVSGNYLVDNKIEVQTVAEVQPEAQPEAQPQPEPQPEAPAQPEPEAPAETPVETQPETQPDNGAFPYETLKLFDDGGIHVYFYYTENDWKPDTDTIRTCCTLDIEKNTIIQSRFGNYRMASPGDLQEDMGVYNGVRYYKRYNRVIYDDNMNVVAQW